MHIYKLHYLWELKKNNIILISWLIKIIHASLFLSLSLSLIHSHLTLPLRFLTPISHSLTPVSHSLNSDLSHHSTSVSSWPTSRPKSLISLRSTPPSTSDPHRWSECLLVDIRYLTRKPMELANPPLLLTQLADVVLVCDWWFFILFVIGDFVWSGLTKKIGDLSFFYLFIFFLLWTGGGGGGCGYGWW